jgi:hypothetical protein
MVVILTLRIPAFPQSLCSIGSRPQILSSVSVETGWRYTPSISRRLQQHRLRAEGKILPPKHAPLQ